MYWLHVYIPHTECVTHKGHCKYARLFAPFTGTTNQGVNQLKRDGGWFEFDSLEEAEIHYRTNWQAKGYILKDRCYCLK
jgi:hypothetical protein